MPESMVAQLLREEIAELEKRKARLDKMIGENLRDSKAQEVEFGKWEKNELLLEPDTLKAKRAAPPAAGKDQRHILLLDRENGCFGFLNDVTRVPKWLDIYCVWNPATTHIPRLIPAVRERVTMVEALFNTQKGLKALAGYVAREYYEKGMHKGTGVTFVFNCGNAPERYAEVEDQLKQIGFEVDEFNGTCRNFADFIQDMGMDWEKYTAKGPKNA